jgi:anti-sigma regulatory factor (Ser/Thr protein kinase)
MDKVLHLFSRADAVGAGLTAERLARAYGWGELEAGECKLLVVELCSNAVRHAHGGECHLKLDLTSLEVVVEDRGPGLPLDILARGERLGPSGPGGLGAGLACARRFSTELSLSNLDGGGARVVARRVRGPHGQGVHR